MTEIRPSGSAPSGLAENLLHKRPAPFSLRLSDDERARLRAEAAGAPLGAYIKAKLLGGAVAVRMRRTGLSVQDRRALAQALALLGRSRFAANLNQLSHAVNVGALILTPEVEDELFDASAAVLETRCLLLVALGLKAEAQP